MGAPEGIAIGNPARIVREMKKWEAIGVDRVNFLLNSLETVPQAEVLASLRLFAKEVMPHFQDRTEMQTAAAGGR
jgi:alkanesulfonate monooxygenase SsuD/methylene tetrahydromethanopterin reductase-like flavin-dependent oxidoreductase (luciferase family)